MPEFAIWRAAGHNYRMRIRAVEESSNCEGDIASLTKVRAAAPPCSATPVSSCLLLAQLNLRYNSLGNEGEAAIRESVRGKEGFELEINTD